MQQFIKNEQTNFLNSMNTITSELINMIKAGQTVLAIVIKSIFSTVLATTSRLIVSLRNSHRNLYSCVCTHTLTHIDLLIYKLHPVFNYFGSYTFVTTIFTVIL